MVTPEERITRLEAIQEANAQQLALVLSRLDQVLNLMESVRQEAREINEATRQESREANEVARREAREMNEETRKDSRSLFLTGLAVWTALVAGLGGGIIAIFLRILERLPS